MSTRAIGVKQTYLVPGLVGAAAVGLILAVGALQPKPPKPEPAVANPGPMQQRMQALADPSQGPQLVEIPANFEFGAKNPDRIVTVGYHWSQDVQGKPQLMAMAIQQFADFLKMAIGHVNEKLQVRFANIDLYPEVPLGICVDGYLLSDFNPNEMSPTAAKHIMQTLMGHINSTLAPTPLQRQQWKNSK